MQGLFSIVPLNTIEWQAVVLISLPVIFIDEILKAVERQYFSQKAVRVTPTVRAKKE